MHLGHVVGHLPALISTKVTIRLLTLEQEVGGVASLVNEQHPLGAELLSAGGANVCAHLIMTHHVPVKGVNPSENFAALLALRLRIIHPRLFYLFRLGR